MATYDRVMQYQRRQVSRGYAATCAAFDCCKPVGVACLTPCITLLLLILPPPPPPNAIPLSSPASFMTVYVMVQS